MIYQINIWTCEGCGATVTTGEETFPYSDPLVSLEHEEWEYIGEMPNQKLVCGICQGGKIKEIIEDSNEWAFIRQAEYIKRLNLPPGVAPIDVPFNKEIMAEVDELPVSQGGLK